MHFRKALMLVFIVLSPYIVFCSESEKSPLHYNLDISIAQDFSVSGTDQITITNTTTRDISSLIFQLPLNADSMIDKRIDPARYDYSYPHGFETSFTEVVGVTSGETKLSYTYLDDPSPSLGSVGIRNFVSVKLPATLRPGETATVALQFRSVIPTKLSSGKFNDVLFMQGGWYPSFSYEQDMSRFYTATYSLKIRHDKDVTVVAGALLIGRERNGESVDTGEITNPIAMLPLVASKKMQKMSVKYQDIDIESYYLPGEERSASVSIAIAKKALAFYKKEYQLELPAKYLIIVENYMGGQSAFSAGNTVFMPNELRRYPNILSRLYEVVLVHEIGHMWWGLGVSYGFDRDNWIGEGLNTFFMNHYFEEKYGTSNNLLSLEKGTNLPNYTYEEMFSYMPYRQLVMQNQGQPPATSRKITRDQSALTTMQYNKGYYIYKIIYQELGGKVFNDLLKYLQAHPSQILTTEGLLAAINKVSGKDLTQVFADWVYANKQFDYRIAKEKTYLNPSYNYTTIVKIENRGEISAPMRVQLTDTLGNVYFEKARGSQDELIEFISTAPPREVVLDPGKVYPDINRVDNYYPVRYKLKRFLPIPESDAYYIFLEPSVFVSNFGSYGTVKARYGYMDDFDVTLEADSNMDYLYTSFQRNRLFDPYSSFYVYLRNIYGISSSALGLTYYWNRAQEQVVYPGTYAGISIEAEDLYRFVLREGYMRFYGFYNYIDIERTKQISRLSFVFGQRYGITPLNNVLYQIKYDMHRDYLGSELDFDQAEVRTDCSFRVGHLKKISLETYTGLSSGDTPEEKGYYMFSPGNLRAIPRDQVVNLHNRNISVLRAAWSLPLAPFIYDFPVFSRELWLDSLDMSLFQEWGALSAGGSRLFEQDYLRTAGLQLNINLLSLAQIPFSFNLIWARPITKKAAHKEPTYFIFGFNGAF